MSKKLAFCCAAVVFVFLGCAVREPLQICPGADSVAQALSSLNAGSKNAGSFKANGQCRVGYLDEAGEPQTQNFPVRLWMDPPTQMYLQGDIFLMPGGIVLGSNSDEFWLLLKPKEISSYFWGDWAQAGYFDELMINPRMVTEAMGVAAVGSGAVDSMADWSLSNQGPFDVLAEHNHEGRVVKKVYVYCCDYTVRKIEYFDPQGEIAVVTELDRYKQIAESFYVPMSVRITERPGDDSGNSAKITLRSAKAATFSDKLRNFVFKRPKRRGLKNGYEIVDGEMVKRW
ncbi:MAG: hypothetical protein JSU70_01345 [Phycisphaerales bacterium]|nr:MAG: hypothetical protein JSU70_01345 [Phycisphaerales bacterium]